MKQTFLFILSLVLFASCDSMFDDQIEGNGRITSQEHTFSHFNQVEIDGAFDVYFYQDSTFSTKIEAESNILPFIELTISGSKLTIDVKEGVSFHLNYPIVLKIGHAGLSNVDLNGSGKLDLGIINYDDLNVELDGSGEISGYVFADQFKIELSGSGDIDTKVNCHDFDFILDGSGSLRLSGSIYKAELEISGSGDVEAEKCDINKCYSTISGTGNMRLSVTSLLNVDISGSGNIYYWGNPLVTQKISGTGKLVRKG